MTPKDKLKRRVKWKLGGLRLMVSVTKSGKKHPLINALIFSTAVILVWRGIWMLIDMLLLPENPLFSALVSIAVGLVILLLDDMKLKELTG